MEKLTGKSKQNYTFLAQSFLSLCTCLSLDVKIDRYKSLNKGAGDVAQLSRALAALVGDLGWVLSPHTTGHNHLVTPVLDLMPSFGLP